MVTASSTEPSSESVGVTDETSLDIGQLTPIGSSATDLLLLDFASSRFRKGTLSGVSSSIFKSRCTNRNGTREMVSSVFVKTEVHSDYVPVDGRLSFPGTAAA